MENNRIIEATFYLYEPTIKEMLRSVCNAGRRDGLKDAVSIIDEFKKRFDYEQYDYIYQICEELISLIEKKGESV